MSKRQITVAVTGLNAIDSPGPGVGVLRSVLESDSFNARIIGLSYESLEPGLYMHDIVTKSYQIPYPSAGSNELLKRLEHIHSKEKIDVIIPNFDAELQNFIRIAPSLQKLGIHTFLPSLKQLESLDKMHLHEFGEKFGFLVPKTKIITDKAEIKKLNTEFTYPLVVKGKFYEAYVAKTEDEAMRYFDKLNDKWGLPILIQEFIKGTEIDVAGLGDGKGNLIGAIPMRKLYVTDKGKGWAGVVLGDKNLIELTNNFIKASHWKGGFELEFLRTDDQQLYLLEVNPRFPAWIHTTTGADQNLPSALVKMALGMDIEPFKEYKVGTMFVRYSWDLITHIDEFETISTLGEL